MFITILKEVGKALLMALLTEEFMKEIIIFALEKLAKLSDTDVDDELVAKVKKALEKKKEESK